MTRKLFAPVLVPDTRPYSGCSMKQGSIYIEDGQLEETYLAHVCLLDCEGRYVEEDLGYFEVKPEYFDCKIENNYDGTLTFYEYNINKVGVQYFRNTFNIYPERIKLVPVGEVRAKIAAEQRHAAAILRRVDSMIKLLKD
jgi:hypothetical protein